MHSSGSRTNHRRALITVVALIVATCGNSLAQLSATSSPIASSVSGIVREAGSIRIVRGARIVVINGANTGASAISDADGVFTLQNLAAESIDLQAAKEGYLGARVQAIDISRNIMLDIRLYAAPPRDLRGAVAIARCNDDSWSWAETPALACTNNGGIATAYVPARAAQR